MNHRAAALVLFAIVSLSLAGSRARGQAAVAEAPSKLALPAADAAAPGVGPIRQEPWFRDLWLKRRSEFADRRDDEHGALAFFGDSITQGWGDDFQGDFKGVKVANRGISGDTTKGLLMRVDDDVLALDPAGVVLLIGTNDVELGVSPQDIAGNIKLLLDKIVAHDPDTSVIICQVMPTSAKKKRPTDKIQAVNREVAAVAKAFDNVTVLDTYTLFANAAGEAKPEEFPDLLHPNAAGYAKWRAALQPLLATLGFVETDPEEFTPEPGFESLYNGRDLTGWGFRPTTDEDRAAIANWKRADPNMPPWPIVEVAQSFDGKTESPDRRFRAIHDRIVSTTPSEGRRVQKLLTMADFPGDFTLRLQFRATPNADSGVYLRGKQLQCRDYPLAGPYKDLKNYKPQDWNDMEVIVRGNTAHCTVNGEVVEDAYELPDTGPIGVEGDRGQMEYRHIRIKRGA